MLGMPSEPPPGELGPAASGQIPVRDEPAAIAPADLSKTAVGYATPHTLRSEAAPQAPAGAAKPTTAGLAPEAPGAPAGGAAFKQTMLGMAPGTVSPEGAPKGNLKQTMLGGVGAGPGPAAGNPDPSGGAFKQTMLGGVGPGQAAPGGEGQPGTHKPTMLGMAPGAPPEPDQPPPAQSAKPTMLGMAAPGPAPGALGTQVQFDPTRTAPAAQPNPGFGGTQVQFSPGAAQPAAPGINPSLGGTQVQFGAAQGHAAPPVANPDLRGTQVQFNSGIAAPGGDRPSTGTLAIEPPAPAHSPGVPGAGVPAGGKPEKKTVLGVAVPGIAPINPGQAKPSTSPPPDPAQFVPAPPPARSATSIVLLIFLALLAIGATVAAIVYVLQKPDSITARVTADEHGDEQLELTCKECPEGTVAKLDAREATFKKSKALLPLSRPLKIGENPITVSVTRPGKRAETFPLTVPVQFRVRGDLTGISKNPPIVTVLVEAVPGTAAVVDGKALTLDEDGKGKYEIDISEDVTGESASIEPLEKRVPYTLTPPGAQPQKGEITLKTGIAALVVDAPGPSIVIDNANFMLAGNTQRGGSVSVAGRPITVDPEGRFAQLMSVSSVGETTILIRANADKHAPRLVPIRIRRVDSLKAEAKRLRSSARTSFADFGENPDKSRGSEVLVEAKVIESRADRHTTVALVEVTSGCPSDSCLARVVYGAKVSLKRDQKVTIAGTVEGAVDGPRTGSQVPEIRADFVVEP